MIGVGYVGLVSGAGFAEIGHTVRCMDKSEEKIRSLQRGQLPIYEQGLGELVVENIELKRLHFTNDLEEAIKDTPVIFIAVGTPMGAKGEADLSAVFAVAKQLGELMNEDKLVVIKSTVPAGTNSIVKKLIESELANRQVSYRVEMASNPEFLKEGTAIGDFLKPDRIVVGAESEETKKKMEDIYGPIVKNGHPLIFMDVTSSEVSKYSSNAMLAAKISFMNEISRFCEKVGADVTRVKEAMGEDPRIGPHFLNAGIGYGGCCLPKDVRALAYAGEQTGLDQGLLKAIDEVNQGQKKWFTRKILEFFSSKVEGKIFALWGLSFKPNTDDIRESPACYIVDTLTAHGAQVRLYDPKAMEHGRKVFAENSQVSFASSSYHALEGCDALILVTEWMEFRQPNFPKIKNHLKSPVIFDARNQYDPVTLNTMGFKYISVGRPNV